MNQTEEIKSGFKTIRDLALAEAADDAAALWEAAYQIIQRAKGTLASLAGAEADPEEDQEYTNPFEALEAVRKCARDMEVIDPDVHQWRSASRRIISAARKAQQLLQHLQLEPLPVEVVPAESDVFTQPTSRPEAARAESLTATLTQEESFTETRQEEADASNLQGRFFGGRTEAQIQTLEQELHELKVEHRNQDHPRIAGTLRRLGAASRRAGDLRQAKQYLEESLRMLLSLYVDTNHPSVAQTLHDLGLLSEDVGDLKQARKYLKKSLHIKRSVYRNRDDPDLAATLHALGCLNARDLKGFKKGKKYLGESLRMKRSIYGDTDHRDLATTLHSLGCVHQQIGDLQQAKLHLQESLRMKGSVYGDRNHPDVAPTLQGLGCLYQQTGDLQQAKQHLEESLRMQRSLYGSEDRPGLGATLHSLGFLSLQLGDLGQAMQYIQEAAKVQVSLYGDNNPPILTT